MMGGMSPGDASRWLGEGRQLRAAKNAVFSIVPNDSEMSYSSVAIDSVVPEKLINSDQDSIYFTCMVDQTESAFQGKLPIVAKFKSCGNVIILAIKKTATGTYIHGVLEDTLLAWNPPKKAGDTCAEDGILSMWKVPNEDVEKFEELAANIRGMADKLISHLPSFKAAKIKSIADAHKYSEAGYERAIKAAVVAGEDLERKAAAGKGKSSGAQKESEGGGTDAKTKWAEVKTALLETHVGNLKLPFDQRYLELLIDKDTGKPTVDGIKQLKLKLKYVACMDLPLTCH